MNNRKYRNHVAAAVERNRHPSASASSSVKARNLTDPVLATVAIGAMLFILGWAVTGIDFLAIFALLVALGYVRVAGAFKSDRSSAAADLERRNLGTSPHALAVDARFHGLAAAGAAGAPAREASWNDSGKGASTRAPRRSAYDGLAD